MICRVLSASQDADKETLQEQDVGSPEPEPSEKSEDNNALPEAVIFDFRRPISGSDFHWFPMILRLG